MLDVNCILGLVKDVALMVFCKKLYQAKEIVVFDSQKFTFKFVFLGVCFFCFLFVFICIMENQKKSRHATQKDVATDKALI